MSTVEVWIANADLEVSRVMLVVQRLAEQCGRDYMNPDDQAVLLPLAVQIARNVTKQGSK